MSLGLGLILLMVEERNYPYIKGNPAAVVQYNTWKGGGIIAVNYEARAFDVKRGMRGDEAKEKCPSIHLVQVPVHRGKADLTKYRNAGKEVVSVLCEFSDCVERASIDEAYIDVTKAVEEQLKSSQCSTIKPEDLPSTWVIGYDKHQGECPANDIRMQGLTCWLSERENVSLDNAKLALAARICEKMRQRVLEVTGFKCSAGISHNKMLSKLACGLHKPNQQSILPMKIVPDLWAELPVGKIRNLGGKLGDSLTIDLRCKSMGDLSKLSLDQLRAKYDEKTSFWLYSLGQGIDNEAVTPRQLPKSIGCGKNFNGKEVLNTKEKVKTWMETLAEELSERLNEDRNTNERIAKTLTVHIRVDNEEKPITTRSCPLASYEAKDISRIALTLISSSNVSAGRNETWHPPLRNISLSAGKFEDVGASGTAKIDSIFKRIEPNCAKLLQKENVYRKSENFLTQRHAGNKYVTKDMSDSCFSSEDSSDFEHSFSEQESTRSVASSDLMSKGKQTTAASSSRGDLRQRVPFTSVVTKAVKVQKGTDVSNYVDKDTSRKLTTTSGTGPLFTSSSCRKRKISESESNFLSVSVEELFPDFGDVDPSLLAILPHQLRTKVEIAVKEHLEKQTQVGIDTSMPLEKHQRIGADEALPLEKHQRIGADGAMSLEKHQRIGADEALPLEKHQRIGADGALPLEKDKCIESVNKIQLEKDESVKINSTVTLEKVEGLGADCAVQLEMDDNAKQLAETEGTREGCSSSEKMKNTSASLNSLKSAQGGSSAVDGLSRPQSDEYIKCRECNRRILTAQFTEHRDYHYALELRKQQLSETRKLIVTGNKRESVKSSRHKTKGNKNSNYEGSSCLSPKIDRFFVKKDK